MEGGNMFSGKARRRFKWKAAVLAGLAAGVLFAIFPHGIPWEGLTFFNPVVMGRSFPQGAEPEYFGTFLIHLVVAVIYGLAIGPVVYRFQNVRAVLLGGLVELGLYLANRAVVSIIAPHLIGNELGVVVTHILFGLVTAAAYKGLARPPAPQSW